MAIGLRFLLVLQFILFVTVTVGDVRILASPRVDSQPSREMSSESLAGRERSVVLDRKAKKIVENFLKYLPCGFPDYGIPPLAPYTNANLVIDIERALIEALLQMMRFRFDGLQKMEIKKLKVGYPLNKEVQFHFNFKQLRATASTLDVDVLLDLLRPLGLSVRYEGDGTLDFILQNLSIEGQFKYKMPIVFGSIEIYKFKLIITLGGVRSNIDGILGDGRVNQLLNDEIEYLVPSYINGHQSEIGDAIERVLLPRLNDHLKGNKIWSVFAALLSPSKKCKAPTPPW